MDEFRRILPQDDVMAPSAEEVERFPRPPRTVTDDENRTVTIEAHTDSPEPLVAMYEEFDDGSRSQGVPPRSESAIREWIESLLADGCNVVVWHDGEAVGHAVLVPVDEEAELAIFVHPAYQSAGIGTALIRALFGHGQANGVDRVWLAVAQTNRIAMKLYEKVGFETRRRNRAEHEMERVL